MDLIEEARVHELDTEIDPPIPPGDWCAACHCEWPCLTSQLANALATEKARVARLEGEKERLINSILTCSGSCGWGLGDIEPGIDPVLSPTEATP